MKHGGHKSFSKKEGAFEKHGGKSKEGSHGSSKKKKNYSYSKVSLSKEYFISSFLSFSIQNLFIS